MNGQNRYQGLVVTILAIAVGLTLVIFAAAAAWAIDSEHLTLTDSQVGFLTTSIGALIGAIATYLGVGRGRQQATEDKAPGVPQAPEAPPPAPPAQPTANTLPSWINPP